MSTVWNSAKGDQDLSKLIAATPLASIQVGTIAATLVTALTAQIGTLLVTQLGHVGTFTLNGATPVVVANANITANSQIEYTFKTLGGTPGAYPAITAISVGTSFTITGTAGDTSIYNYAIQG